MISKNQGKIYMTIDVVDSGLIPEIFSYMGFTPYRAESLYVSGMIEYIGTSHLFDVIEQGFVIPTYECKIEQPEFETLKVTVIKR